MHKIVSLIFFLALPLYFFAEENNLPPVPVTAESIIKARSFLNEAGNIRMQNITKGLPLDQRNDLYYAYEMDFWKVFIPNLFVPSLGSWLNGDHVGAIIIDVGLGGGLLIAGLSVGFLLAGGFHTGLGEITYGVAIFGIGLFCASLLANLIFFPAVFTWYWNKKLLDGLYLEAMDSSAQSEWFAMNPVFNKQNAQLVHLDIFQYRF